MNKQSRKVLLGAATLAAVIGGGANAFAADTAKVDIDAKIVQAIAITAVLPLKFGTASVATTAGGSITVGPNGNRAISAGTGVSLVGAVSQAGTFTVKGATVAHQVTAPAKATLTITGGGTDKMTVTAFHWDSAAGATGAIFPLANATPSATETYQLGGTLNISASQAPGTYTGQVTLTASYQ